MAKPVSQITLGIDVAKDQLVARNWADPDTTITVQNHPRAIRAWLCSFHGPLRIALEPTSTYHLACVDEAFKLGIEVYLVGSRQLAHYREAVGMRHKTDPDDAYLLARRQSSCAATSRAAARSSSCGRCSSAAARWCRSDSSSSRA